MCPLLRHKKKEGRADGGEKKAAEIITALLNQKKTDYLKIIAIFLFPCVIFCSILCYNFAALQGMVKAEHQIKSYHNIISPLICMRCH